MNCCETSSRRTEVCCTSPNAVLTRSVAVRVSCVEEDTSSAVAEDSSATAEISAVVSVNCCRCWAISSTAPPISTNASRACSTVSAPLSLWCAPSSTKPTTLAVWAWISSISLPIDAAARPGLLGELAHLFGDDREAAALLAGARRLDRGVQRQQVGLAGDAGDRLDDAADLARLPGEIGDRRRWRCPPSRARTASPWLASSAAATPGVAQLARALGRRRPSPPPCRACSLSICAWRSAPVATSVTAWRSRRPRGSLLKALADLVRGALDAARRLDEQAERAGDRGLDLVDAVREVLARAPVAEAVDVDSHRHERVVIESIDDRLDVVVEDRVDRPDGFQPAVLERLEDRAVNDAGRVG